MHIAFRADSSTIIGHGHIMRCLTLAHALVAQVKNNKDLTLQISFICRDQPNNINQLISQTDFTLITLPLGEQVINQQDSTTWLTCSQKQDAQQCIKAIESLSSVPVDMLIVDHYAIDRQWHKIVASHYQQLMVIDDLANRSLQCDVLLDQTLNRQAKNYQQLIPENCLLLLGQNYMLLRYEFSQLQKQAMIQRQLRSKQLSAANILISMGGSDPDNVSERVLLAIAQLQQRYPDVTASLVLSSQSKHLKKVAALSDSFTWCTLIIDTKNMAALMLTADIAIGASGATAWERCCLGLPSLTTVNAKNQQLIANNLADAGASINLGWHQKVSGEMISTAIKTLFNNPKAYLAMVNNNFFCCDGLGANRVAQVLLEQITPKNTTLAAPCSPEQLRENYR